MKNPIFIIGNPRSGTTLLRVILNAHPDLLITPECGFAIWLYPKYRNKDVSSEIVKDQFIHDLILTRKFETWELDNDELREYIFENEVGNYADLVELVYKSYGKQHNIHFKRWGDKNNFYLNHVADINSIFPNAQFIHIIRDGRDVACSYIELSKKEIHSQYKPNLPTSIAEISNEWVGNNQEIASSLSEIETERWIVVKHEDVVTEFSKTLHKVSQFLNLNYDSGIEEFHLNRSASEPEEFLQWKTKLYTKLDKSSVERYKDDLTKEQVNRFNSIAMDTLLKYGYHV